MPESTQERKETLFYFVDEAGDPTVFDAKGRVNVGAEGCSSHFILGKLDVADPAALAGELDALRSNLLAEPYFKGVPSMQPERRKTAVGFHAKDDPAEVRYEVFKLLREQDVRFYAVVRDKQKLAVYIRQRSEQDRQYRHRPNELYDSLVRELFRPLHRLADRMEVCFAKRGDKSRDHALLHALANAERDFEAHYGFGRKIETVISSGRPPGNGGLQAVDYYLWALQRFYARQEERYIEMIWPQVGEIHDLDWVEQGRPGVYYRKDKPLNLAARQPQKKKSGI